jgi:hypothetical protein
MGLSFLLQIIPGEIDARMEIGRLLFDIVILDWLRNDGLNKTTSAFIALRLTPGLLESNIVR